MPANIKLGVKEIWVATLLFWAKGTRLDSLVQENSLTNAFLVFHKQLAGM